MKDDARDAAGDGPAGVRRGAGPAAGKQPDPDPLPAGAILVISAAADIHAATVLGHLATRAPGAARLLDLSAYPARAALDMAFDAGGCRFLWREPGQPELDLTAVRAVWWRRPQPFTLAPEIAGRTDRTFAHCECQAAIQGLWRAMTGARWINHPSRDEDAARKVVQLRLAAELGLAIPDTLVTSDPAAARAFIARHGAPNVVYKAFTGLEEAWRETRRLRPGEEDLLDAVRHAPVIFQDYIPAGADLRVTMIDGTPYAAAIHTRGTAYETDFRMVMDEARMEPATLPDDVLARLRALMDRFGLTYGAIDLRRTPEGRHVFLEINPAGQFLFVEQGTGLPIAAALADCLVKFSTTNRAPGT